jgi:hypothetical protein
MKENQDYIRDIAEMRSLMERSSKFMSLSGLAGIIVGMYALVGAYIAYKVLHFNPDGIAYNTPANGSPAPMLNVFLLATFVLVLAVSTVAFLSYKNANKNGEKFWNPTARRLVINMAVPLIAGGILVLILISKDLIGLIAPFTLIFYGLSLYNAGKFTYAEVRSLGLVQVGLGLAGTYFIEYGLLIWTLGFGIVNIVYGIYLHYRYEK